MSLGRPGPTGLAVALVAAALVPAALAVASPVFLWLAVALDAAVVLLCTLDFFSAPRASDLEVRRVVEPVLSSGVANPVRLELRLSGQRPVRGRVRDEVPPGQEVHGHEQPFALTLREPRATVSYTLTPPARGDLRLGDVHLRLLGPLGLCARQVRLPAAQTVKVYPDLTALTREALTLAMASDAPAERTLRRSAEGR
ncbi:MAG TPA: DUF58 domain-containing protein, partial [Archangium sp.]